MKFKWMFPISVTLLLLSAVVMLQMSLGGDREGGFIERIRYIPSGKHLRLISAGYHALAADLIWSWTVVSFGEHFKGDKDYTWLPKALDVVITLDPRFRDVYLYGGIMLAMEAGKPGEAIRLLERGVENIPDDWQLHFFLGFYRVFYRIDPHKGIANLKRAASLPGHPAYLPLLVARSYSKLGRIELAIDYLKQVRDIVADPELKLKVEAQISELIKEARG
jgi:hypothetical protein